MIPGPPRVLKLALPVPLPQLFDYLPAADGAPAVPGVRAVVRFGSRSLVGVVVECDAPAAVAGERLLRVTRVLDDGEPLADAALLGLLRWCWQYYKHAPGDVLLAALPPSLRQAGGVLPEPPLRFRLTAAGRERLDQPAGRAKSQAAMLHALASGPLDAAALAEATTGRWRATLQRIQEQGWVVAEPANDTAFYQLTFPPCYDTNYIGCIPEPEKTQIVNAELQHAYIAHLDIFRRFQNMRGQDALAATCKCIHNLLEWADDQNIRVKIQDALHAYFFEEMGERIRLDGSIEFSDIVALCHLSNIGDIQLCKGHHLEGQGGDIVAGVHLITKDQVEICIRMMQLQ